MPTTTTGSLNIATLDSVIVADLCAGILYIDITTSVYIGAGAGTSGGVLGASVRVTNPSGIVIKEYPTSGYDIYPPMTDVISVAVPTIAGGYQLGKYIVSVILTDANGTQYTITKTVSICAPNLLDKSKKFGLLSATLNGICRDGKVYVTADAVPVYNGALSDSQVNAFTLEYPTSSGLAILSTTSAAFSTMLFEGVYKFAGTSCATYSFGDGVTVKVSYVYKREKNIRCILDECCIAGKLGQLGAQITSDCTEAERQVTQDIIIGTLRLVKTIEVRVFCGLDAGDYIDELETLLGCVCTCNCADGTPIINTTPARDVVITGCNVEKTTSGLTDSYVIDNFAYTVTVTPNGGVLVINAPVLTDCTKTQTLTFSIAAAYSQIKNQIINTTEYNFWASVINHTWDDLSLVCLGNPVGWDTWTFFQRTQYIINRFCVGAICYAEISTNAISSTGADVEVTWTNVESVFEVSAYLDGVLAGVILAPTEEFTFYGAADGLPHTYKLIARCTNGVGNTLSGAFTEYGCPAIATPTVTATVVTSDCPYDLTALEDMIPVGTDAEWHNQNNTLTSSLVLIPDNVTISGVYYLFAVDATGCYSASRKVTLTCTAGTCCSEPQGVIVEEVGGNFRISFNAAACPPPDNSYTVKRRPFASDPDSDASYTTLTTPTYSLSLLKYQTLDITGLDNTLYVYRVISNCAEAPLHKDYTFANIICPTLTLSSDFESIMDYSFEHDDTGEVDKYIVTIYDMGGHIVHPDTINPVFSSPITGTFLYLDTATEYSVKIEAFIGTYSKVCPAVTQTTSGALGMNVFLYRFGGAASGTLEVNISGGTAPYTYTFHVNAVGACEDHMIDDPTGTTSDTATTTYSVTLYGGTTYQWYVTVIDDLGAMATSNYVTNPACLVPETLISMADGSTKALGELKVDDELFDDNKVTAFEQRVVDKLYVINGGLLKASEGHVHILANGNLVQSVDLKKGDFLQGRNGTGVTAITDIEVLEGEFDVINIATSTMKYIANGILTHNKFACPA